MLSAENIPSRASVAPLIYRLIFLFLITVPGTGLQAQQAKEKKSMAGVERATAFPANDAIKNAAISYQLIPGVDHTWGYNILVNKKVMIKQSSIPGMPGNNGFTDKKSADGVAKLVISKMKKGEMPPTVTIDEMKKLKAL
ncbi:MAG: DUF4907 domain-containing protein [Bacteroidota bacterium]